MTRAFCYIDDAVDGILAVLERGGHLGIYHIGTDVETTIAARRTGCGMFWQNYSNRSGKDSARKYIAAMSGYREASRAWI